MARNLFIALSVSLASLHAATSFARVEGPVQADFFEKSIRPILAANCFECHGPQRQKAGLRLDSRAGIVAGGDSGPAAVSGKPPESLLISAVRYQDDRRMPPKHKLKDDEIAALTEWVKQGLPWPDKLAKARPAASDPKSTGAPAGERFKITDKDRQFWSFQPVVQAPLPRVHDTSWPKTPIDHFVLAELEANGLRPVEAADKRTLIRRATFDLIGLPPQVEEIDAFLKDDRPDAFARVVDRLLASPHYGERWGRHWLDIARYGEDQAHTFQVRKYPAGYRYRDWLVRALNSDLAFDRFILEQIAGDLLEEPGRLERLPALGFFALGPVYYGDRKKLDQLDDRIDTCTRGFLGLTVACARCHDHKFDPIPTTDYYALAGVFGSSEYTEAPLAPQPAVEAYRQAASAVDTQKRQIDQFLGEEAARSSKGKSPKIPKNQLEKNLPAEARNKLAGMRAELEQLKKKVPPTLPVAHALTEAVHTANMRVCIRGSAGTLGEEVPRRFLAILGGHTPFTKGSGRLELARAIADKTNPLTARVMVNRIWQHHLGKGLVRTPSNFGALGERPSNPKLLDYLAGRFMASGWSIKSVHREIMLSATYQLGSRFDARNGEKDPEAKLFWRMNRRRLEVEAWRDAMLAVAGNLDRTIGGPSVDLASPANRRRTFYAAISRHDLNGLLRLFDFPDPNITSGERTVTTVPLQQLFVLNSEFIVRAANRLVAHLTPAASEDDSSRIRRAFLLLYGRPVRARELQLGLDYLHAPGPASVSLVRDYGALTRWQEYAQALLSANEFLYLD